MMLRRGGARLLWVWLLAGLPGACATPAALQRAPFDMPPFWAQWEEPKPSKMPKPVATRLLAPVPVSPANGAVLSGTSQVALHWRIPPHATAGRTFVEVVARGDGNSQVFSNYVHGHEVTVSLPQPRGAYAWRVYTVATADARYVSSPWCDFRMADSGPVRSASP